MSRPRFITNKEAAESIKALPKERKIIHCFVGNFGKDWKRSEVLREVRRAKRVAWTKNMFDHQLAVESDDGSSVRHFDLQCL